MYIINDCAKSDDNSYEVRTQVLIIFIIPFFSLTTYKTPENMKNEGKTKPVLLLLIIFGVVKVAGEATSLRQQHLPTRTIREATVPSDQPGCRQRLCLPRTTLPYTLVGPANKTDGTVIQYNTVYRLTVEAEENSERGIVAEDVEK